MKKTVGQIILAVVVLAVFLFGSYVLYPVLGSLLSQITAGSISVINILLGLLILVAFVGAQLAFLFAAIEIFNHGTVRILKILLWLSIPSFSLMGYITYMFAFGPYLILTLGGAYAEEKLQLLTNVDFNLFGIKYDLSFADQSNGVFAVGVNVMAILFLFLLNRFYEPRPRSAKSRSAK
jgi:hypothetical protein